MDVEPADDWETIVIGAGAAGLIAAERSAAIGRKTLLIEKSNKPGVKILMSGGTRCNLTQQTDRRGIVAAFGRQGSFLHSALSYLDPSSVVRLFESAGVPTKVETTGKIFPQSDRAIDVRDALVTRLKASGAKLQTGEAVQLLEQTADQRFHIESTAGSYSAEHVIVTSGGQSYPGCGTTGDGYAWLRSLGHSLIKPVPALCPLLTSAGWLHELQGITFEDVRFWIELSAAEDGTGDLIDRQGACRSSLLLTHFGLSGPAAMNVSRMVARFPGRAPCGYCDFFPDVRLEELERRLKVAFHQAGKRSLSSALGQFLPQRFADALLRHLNLVGNRRGSEVPIKWTRQIALNCKRLEIPISGTKGFAKAEVTAGGVPLDEVSSKSLESKRVAGLFLAGEILDLDGPIGGYNFQAAFSTGWVAGYQGQTPERV